MEDARRFARYLVPGAVFGVQASLLLWMLCPRWVEKELPLMASDKGIGFAAAGLLASGGLGFVFGVIHHEIHWSGWFRRICPTDYCELVKRLMRDGSLVVVVLEANGTVRKVDPATIDRRSAWLTMSSVSYAASPRNPIREADPKISSLANTVHSLGTVRVASVAALIAAAVIAARVSDYYPHGWPLVRFLFALVWAIGVVVFFQHAYRRTGQMTQSIIELVFVDGVNRGRHPSVPQPPIMVTVLELPPNSGMCHMPRAGPRKVQRYSLGERAKPNSTMVESQINTRRSPSPA